MINSNKKMLSEMYHHYTKSVQVHQVIERRKQTADGSQLELLASPQSNIVTNPDSPSREHDLDRVEIELDPDNFPDRVDDTLPPDHFVGKKPPGLSRPVMYINNTKVKRMLNQSVLQGNHAHLKNDQKGTSVGESQDYLLEKIKELKAVLSPERKKPVVILKDSKQIFKGQLKFFNEEESYGFITLEEGDGDVFVYLDELKKSGLAPEDFKTSIDGKKMIVICSVVEYIGKRGKCRKAVDIKQVYTEDHLTPSNLSRKKLDSI